MKSMITKEIEALKAYLAGTGVELDPEDVETLAEIYAEARVEKQIEKALSKGYGIDGDIRVHPFAQGDTGRYVVWVDEKWFGIWDTERKTFVD